MYSICVANLLRFTVSNPVAAISKISTPSIAILLPVLNGARYLPDQLASLLAQTRDDWQLLIADDGSTDDSREILEAFVVAHPDKVQLFDGPRQGISANVLSLLARVNPGIQAVAFCDQDDVWDADRLAQAIAALGQSDTPSLYCSRTRLVDETETFLRLSPPRPRPPSFQNALVQNIASGNTMVLNRAGWTLLAREGARAFPAHHDWWVYQVISGAGGHVLHDDTPRLNYRQHRNNALGAATGLRGAIKRFYRMVSADLSRDVSSHLAALNASHDAFTPDNVTRLIRFTEARTQGPFGRLRGIISAGVYRQPRLGTLGLWVSVLLGRF